MKTVRFLALVSMFLGSYAAADDTTIEFTKIDSGAAGTELTSISSQSNDDGVGRYHGFAVVNRSGALSLDLVKVAGMTRPEPSLKIETTGAISSGVADANIVSGTWTRPNVVPTLGSSNATECAVTWADAIGNLPQPDGIDAFFDGYYCMTSGATCTPGTQFSRYYGSGGPDWVPDGERICYNAGTYGYYNSGTGIGYNLQGETNVTCTNICM